VGQSEVKGLWFVVLRRYLLERHDPGLVGRMAAHMDPPYRSALLEPYSMQWYPEACLTQVMRAYDDLITHGDERRLLAAVEDCTLQGVHRFFQALLRLTSPDFLLKKMPVLWRYVRRNQGSLSVETDAVRAIAKYVDFPYFDNAHYRVLALGTLRPLATLCGGTNPRADVLGFGKDWLTVEVRYR
jgi:hypothetical protein